MIETRDMINKSIAATNGNQINLSLSEIITYFRMAKKGSDIAKNILKRYGGTMIDRHNTHCNIATSAWLQHWQVLNTCINEVRRLNPFNKELDSAVQYIFFDMDKEMAQ